MRQGGKRLIGLIGLFLTSMLGRKNITDVGTVGMVFLIQINSLTTLKIKYEGKKLSFTPTRTPQENKGGYEGFRSPLT